MDDAETVVIQHEDSAEEATQVITPESEPTSTPSAPSHEPSPLTTEQEVQEAPRKRSKLALGMVAAMVTAALAGAGFWFFAQSGSNSKEPTEQVAPPEEVATPVVQTIADFKTSIGKCKYTGEVNEKGLPHGNGEARFTDGRHYKGSFSNGKMNGQGKFTLTSGDVFEGEMRDDYFYQGRYTMNDGNYFEGTFSRGEINEGTWYDKNGEKL